jgi:hypothetical protein
MRKEFPSFVTEGQDAWLTAANAMLRGCIDTTVIAERDCSWSILHQLISPKSAQDSIAHWYRILNMQTEIVRPENGMRAVA